MVTHRRAKVSGKRGGTVRRLPAAERRDQLLDVAADILVEGGMRALTMERLAERAGVSKGLGYAYFQDAEETALALWDREVGEVYRRIEEATAGAGSLDDLFGLAVSAYLDVLDERGPILGGLQAHLSHGRLESRITPRVRDFLRFWQDRLAAFLKMDRTTSLAMAAMATAAVEGCGRLWQFGRLSRAETERLTLAFVLDGVRAAVTDVAAPKRRPHRPALRAPARRA